MNGEYLVTGHKPKSTEQPLPDTQRDALPVLESTPPAIEPTPAFRATSTDDVEVASQTITFEELDRLRNSGEEVVVLDVRT